MDWEGIISRFIDDQQDRDEKYEVRMNKLFESLEAALDVIKRQETVIECFEKFLGNGPLVKAATESEDDGIYVHCLEALPEELREPFKEEFLNAWRRRNEPKVDLTNMKPGEIRVIGGETEQQERDRILTRWLNSAPIFVESLIQQWIEEGVFDGTAAVERDVPEEDEATPPEQTEAPPAPEESGAEVRTKTLQGALEA